MKAIVVEECGGPEVLRLKEVPDPAAGAGEVAVRVRAAGVNPVETYQRAGSQGYAPALPFTPGADGAGIVESVGAGVTAFAPGDKVYIGGSLTGTYAERCLCRETQVHPLPASVTFEEGACLYINYGTAYRALFQRGGAAAGETVLVHGATGGVGIAAVQWARLRGLTVIGTYGSGIGEALLREQGVEYRFDHGDAGRFAEIMEVTGGRGVDIVIEMLANVNLPADLEILAMRGRVVVVGSRGDVSITPRAAMRKDGDIRGMVLPNASPEEFAEIHAATGAALECGGIRPVIRSVHPLADAHRAHVMVMEPGSHGKIVLSM